MSVEDDVRKSYFAMLKNKGKKGIAMSYDDENNADRERRHQEKLEKNREKELKKQQKKMKKEEKQFRQENGAVLGDPDDELPSFMLDSTIRAAQREREEKKKEEEKAAKKA